MATEVTTDDLEQAIANGAWVLDVREPWEFEEGHVPTAHHIPLGELADNVDKVADGERVFVICAAGGRSMTAANFLESQGVDCVSVAGGTKAWIAEGKTVSNEPSL